MATETSEGGLDAQLSGNPGRFNSNGSRSNYSNSSNGSARMADEGRRMRREMIEARGHSDGAN